MAYGDVQLPVDGAGTKLLTVTGMPAQPGDVEAEATASINLEGEQIPPAESASATTPGCQAFYIESLDDAPVEVMPGPGRMWGYHLFNPGIAVAYVQFWDDILVNVTVGTTPPTWVFALPANADSQFGVDNQLNVPIEVTIGLVFAATTTPGGSGTPAAGILATIFRT